MNGGFNRKLIVHKGFQGLTLIHGEHRPGSVAVYQEGRTTMTI